jgi:hypothetical protein
MAKSAQQVYDEIKSFIDSHNNYPTWCSGIASNPRERLFQDHNVSEKSDYWIYRQCQSEQSARNVEEALLKLGCDGGTGGGDESTVYVYAYRKSTNTNP